MEWHRVTEDGGTVFIIAPKRDALPADRLRPISTINEIVMAHVNQWTTETAPPEVIRAAGSKRGHYFVWTLELAIQVVEACFNLYDVKFEVLEALHTDDKVIMRGIIPPLPH